MELLAFISDPDRKRQLAVATGASPGYLWQIATRWARKGGKPKQASPTLAQMIERETERIGPERVPKESMRPDIWPSLDAAVPADSEALQPEAKVA